MKFLNLKSPLIVIFSLLMIFLSSQIVFGQIIIDNRIRKDVPIKIEVENAGSEDWVNDLEIKVTNIGKKPIYYLFFALVFDDVKTENGTDIGFTFVHGGRKMISLDKLAQETDIFIQPNESYTFKIHKNFANGWKFKKEQDNIVEPKTAYFRLGFINFGDGTGRDGGGNPVKAKLSI